MEANGIFSKLNMKNYNNELEKILEAKQFSSDIKNLLLSMLYKAENAYKDYQSVKVEVLSEKEFIEHLLYIIQEKCTEIELIDPSETLKPSVDKESGKIMCFPNEKSLLSSVWEMGEKHIKMKIEYEYVREAIEDIMYVGNNVNQVEVIRDFNGWSWDCVVNEIDNIKYNVIYQSLLLICGAKLIYATINNGKGGNNLIQKIGKESPDLQEKLYILTLELCMRESEKMLDKIVTIKKEKTEQLALFQNKKIFVQKITNAKKAIASKIEQLDKIINNTCLLKEEYDKRNSLLPNKEKIFSINYLAKMLKKEREQYLDKIKEYNTMIDPKNFVGAKEGIEKEVALLEKVNLDKDNYQEYKMVDFCKECLKYVKICIEKIEEREEIINWIYKIRYYGYVPFSGNTYLKDINDLEIMFRDIIMLLIKKAQTYKVWENFSEDEELTYLVIKELLNSKMINLEGANMSCKYKDHVLYVEYYDADILEKKAEFKREHVRIKKKVRLFL